MTNPSFEEVNEFLKANPPPPLPQEAAPVHRRGPALADTDPELIKQLRHLFDEYGPAGVRYTVERMVEAIRRAANPDMPMPYKDNLRLTDAEYQAEQEAAPPRTLEQDLAAVLNRHSLENRSNTPDFLLAAFMIKALEAAQVLVNRRTHWWELPDSFQELVEKQWKSPK